MNVFGKDFDLKAINQISVIFFFLLISYSEVYGFSYCSTSGSFNLPFCDANYKLLELEPIKLCNGKIIQQVDHTFTELVPMNQIIEISGLPPYECEYRLTCFSKDSTPCNIPMNRPETDYRNGDEGFCSQECRGGYNPKLSCVLVETPCYCMWGDGFNYIEKCVDQGIIYNITTGPISRLGYLIEDAKFHGRNMSLSINDFLIDVRKDKMILNCPTSSGCRALSKVENSSVHLTCEGKACTYEIPDPILKLQPSYRVLVADSDNLILARKEVNSTDFCDSIDCIFCSDAFEYPDCLENWEKAALYSTTIIVGLAILAVALTIVIFIFLIFIKLIKFIVKKFKNRKLSKIDKEGKKKAVKSTFNSRGYNLLPTVLMTLTLPILISACSNGMSVQSQNLVCTHSGSEEVCSYNLITTITLSDVSQVACLTVVDNNGNSLDEIKLEYLYFMNESPSVLDFYTSDWVTDHYEDGVCEDITGCDDDDTDLCLICDDDYCLDVNEGGILTPGKIPSTFADYPIRTRCDKISHRSCAFQEGCNFNSWILKPISPVLKSYKHTYTIPYSFIDVSSLYNQKVTVKMGQSSVSSTFSNSSSPFQLVLEGWLGTTSLIDVSRFSNVFYPDLLIDSRSSKGIPTVGTLFEVQANTENDLVKHIPGSVLYGDLCSYNSINWEKSVVNCRYSSYSEKLHYDRLPLNVTNGIVSGVSDGTSLNRLVGIYTKGPGILLTASFQNMIITRKVIACEEKFGFIFAGGCYNCESGTKLKFSSLGNECVWQVSSKTLILSKSTIISTLEFEVNSFPSKSDNSHIVIFDNGAYSYSVKVEFYSEEPTVDIGTIDNYNSTSIEHDSNNFGDFLSDFFSSLGGMIITIIIGIIFIVLFVLICWCFIKICVAACVTKIN